MNDAQVDRYLMKSIEHHQYLSFEISNPVPVFPIVTDSKMLWEICELPTDELLSENYLK